MFLFITTSKYQPIPCVMVTERYYPGFTYFQGHTYITRRGITNPFPPPPHTFFFYLQIILSYLYFLEHWLNTGRTVADHWLNTGRTMADHWLNTGRALPSCCFIHKNKTFGSKAFNCYYPSKFLFKKTFNHCHS